MPARHGRDRGPGRALRAGGAEVALCAANPFSTQDDVVAALADDGVDVLAAYGESAEAYASHVAELASRSPAVALDDGADLIGAAHADDALVGATEETTTGLVRLRAMAAEGTLGCPVLAVNEALSERTFNDRYGTGQSTLDGILRATNVLLAGRTVVVLGYGATGTRRRPAGPRRGRVRDRVRGRPDGGAGGAHGGLRRHARAARPPSAATSSSP